MQAPQRAPRVLKIAHSPTASPALQAMSLITLRYFALRALAEPIKITLAYGDVEYTLEVIQFPDWGGGKKADRSVSLFGALPAAILPNGKLVSQSAVILRCVAKLANCIPADEDDRLNCEMIAELAKEMNDINPIFVFHENGSDGQKAAMDKYFASAPEHLKNATAFLGTKEFFGGATPSYGDFAFFHILDTIAHVKAGFLNAYPELLAFHGRVKGLPQLAKYFAERPQTLGMPGSMINPK